MTKANPYQPGAALQDGSYIVREADQKLQQAILNNGNVPYFLAARQSGKSSILARTQSVLKSSELKIAIVDLQEFAPVALSSYERFVSAFISEILTEVGSKKELGDKLTLFEAETNPRFLQDALSAIVMHTTGRLVVCIDEIDVLRRCDFKNGFLGQIRALCNKRSREPDFRRIQFVLAGATPAAKLISNLLESPFNVGDPISLDDLSSEELKQLVHHGWPTNTKQMDEAAQMLIEWTSGSVFLCQHILHRAFYRFYDKPDSTSLPLVIERVIAKTIVEAPETIHFRNIERVLSGDAALLSKWRAWTIGAVPDTEIVDDLLMIGICRRGAPFRNKLYECVFGSRGPLSLFVSEPACGSDGSLGPSAWTFDADNIDI